LQPDPFEIVASRLWSGEAMEEIFRSAEEQLTSRSRLWEAEGRTQKAPGRSRKTSIDTPSLVILGLGAHAAFKFLRSSVLL
jgi:hypothetical protein